MIRKIHLAQVLDISSSVPTEGEEHICKSGRLMRGEYLDEIYTT